MKIRIRNLPFRTKESDVKELFSQYGKVSKIEFEYEQGRPRGFGVVEMEDSAEADKAIAELDGSEFLGREIIVSEDQEDKYFNKLDESVKKRPECVACGDPVKIIVHSGGVPMAAQHCKDCYAELRWGKVPRMRGRRSGF